MAFNIRSLSLYASAPVDTNVAVNFYTYATADAAATVLAAGYFNDARSKLQVNDVIECMAVATGTGDRLKLTVTAAPATGNVTVAVDPEAAAA